MIKNDNYNINDYLKDDKELQKAVIEEFLKEIAELKAENEKLKSEVGKLTQTCGSLLNIQYALADSCKKYSETLQEIKAIVKNICDGCTSECDCDEDCNYFLITEALTKAEEE